MVGDWHQYKVGDLFDLKPGFAFKSSDFTYTGSPVIKIKNVKANAVVLDDLSYVDEEFLERKRSYIVNYGDILITMSGNRFGGSRDTWVGKVAQFRSSEPSLLNQRVAILRPKAGAMLDQHCCSYILGSSEYQNLFIAIATSSGGQANLSPGQILGTDVLLPPYEERRAIAHILGMLDDKIALNRRMNATLEAMARALFKSWFVGFDPVRAKAERPDPGLPILLADFFPDSFEDSELGEIPKGWKVGRFGDAVEQFRDQEHPPSSPDTLFHHCSLPALDDGQTPKLKHGESIRSLKSRASAGVILLSRLNPEIECVWLDDVRPDERAVCSTEFLVLRTWPPVARNYVYCRACLPSFRQQIESLVTGPSKRYQRAQVGSIFDIEATIPPSSLIAAFERSAASRLERTFVCRHEARILVALRDTLLPKLISGEPCMRVDNLTRATRYR